jgi:DNA-binding beta-propeller fold protein YncE
VTKKNEPSAASRRFVVMATIDRCAKGPASRLALAWGLAALPLGCGGEARDDNPWGDGHGEESVTSDGSGAGPGGLDAGEGSTGAEDEDEGDDGVKFDTPAGDGVDDGGDCLCGHNDWSYVFIANSSEGTVSKIDTRTMVEEGRYLTRPDGGGSPSRTSVSVDGRAVVVANRHVGLVKIWAREADCKDTNGIPGIQTSTGKDDVLAWGEDECVDWYVDFPGKTVQRPVQWTAGTGPCHANQKIWTTTGAMGNGPGQCGKSGVWVHRLDGETGMIEDEVHISDTDFPCDHTGTDLGLGLGPYGGAVDFEGNFWFHGWGNGKLARVDFETLDVEIHSGGGYGITVDTQGRVWLNAGVKRFDPLTNQWANANAANGGSGGIAQDLQGRIWYADNDQNVGWVDMETLMLGDIVTLPAGSGWVVKGVSADIDGNIWAVRQGETVAYKIDPDTYAVEIYDGLNGPYTYSDMTGGQLTNVTCNPPAG